MVARPGNTVEGARRRNATPPQARANARAELDERTPIGEGPLDPPSLRLSQTKVDEVRRRNARSLTVALEEESLIPWAKFQQVKEVKHPPRLPACFGLSARLGSFRLVSAGLGFIRRVSARLASIRLASAYFRSFLLVSGCFGSFGIVSARLGAFLSSCDSIPRFNHASRSRSFRLVYVSLPFVSARFDGSFYSIPCQFLLPARFGSFRLISARVALLGAFWLVWTRFNAIPTRRPIQARFSWLDGTTRIPKEERQ
jgi:hypothetical protein